MLSTKLLEIAKNSHTREQQHIKAQHSTTTMSDKVPKPKLEQLHINIIDTLKYSESCRAFEEIGNDDVGKESGENSVTIL